MESLKEVRQRKGVTKVAVAKHLGITEKTYSKYESRPELMKIETAQKVAEFLGVDISNIFFGFNSN